MIGGCGVGVGSVCLGFMDKENETDKHDDGQTRWMIETDEKRKSISLMGGRVEGGGGVYVRLEKEKDSGPKGKRMRMRKKKGREPRVLDLGFGFGWMGIYTTSKLNACD